MGSGKSTLGKRLARELNVDFNDLDVLIEETTGTRISKIFELSGEDYFRHVENAELNRIINEKDDYVLSTGGGTPCFLNNIQLMKNHGTVIYIKIKPGILASRLTIATTPRPLLRDKNPAELRAYIEETLARREKYYLQADHVIEDDNLNVKKVIDAIQDNKR